MAALLLCTTLMASLFGDVIAPDATSQLHPNDVLSAAQLHPDDLLLDDDVDEILHTEHAQDLLFSRDGVTSRDALIFLYADRCRYDVDVIVTSALMQKLPRYVSLSVMRHNYEATRSNVWWEQTTGGVNPPFQLKFNNLGDICSCFIYLPQGAQTLFEGECQNIPATREQLLARYWKMSTFQVVVINRYEQPVKVAFSGKGPKMQDLFLPPGSSTIIWAFPGYYMHAFSLENDDFIHGWFIVNRNTTLIEIRNVDGHVSATYWRMVHGLHIETLLGELQDLRWSHATRHIDMIVQPPLVHNFSKSGFIKTKIPQGVYQELSNIYESEAKNLDIEYYPTHFTIWNLDEVKIEQITLPEQLSTILSNQLTPIMEEFCQCRLKATVGHGIRTRLRRYPYGARVRMHVDELESGHVIGSILHISRDLAKNEDWPLEVIDFGGKRQTIGMLPGDMVIFESSRLPHGRPSVFKGKYFVNTFFYYEPVSGWHNGKFVDQSLEKPFIKESGHAETELKTEL